MTDIISPSMMCADISNLKETLEVFKRQNIEYLHIDVMDGVFVPNYCLSPDYCRALRKLSDIPLDIHLMIENPEDKINWFNIKAGDYVSVHCESTNHLQRALCRIKEKGAKTMVALNPATPIINIENVLDDIDAVLIMTVNPGYAGQKLIPHSLTKIQRLREYLDKNGYGNIEIEVDGNVSFDNAAKMKAAGANMYVAGSSSVFSQENSIENNIIKFKKMIKTGL